MQLVSEMCGVFHTCAIEMAEVFTNLRHSEGQLCIQLLYVSRCFPGALSIDVVSLRNSIILFGNESGSILRIRVYNNIQNCTDFKRYEI